MDNFTVHKKNGKRFTLKGRDPYNKHLLTNPTSAQQNITLSGEDTLDFNISATGLLDFSYGDRIEIHGRDYWLRSQPSVEKVSQNMYNYQVQFVGVLYELIKSQYRLIDVMGTSPSSDFTLTGELLDFLRLIPLNTQRDFGSLWSFDQSSCPKTKIKTLSFSKENCLQALQKAIQEYERSFYVEQKDGKRIIKINSGENIISPPSGASYFEYGKGKGLYNLKLQKTDNQSLITRLWAEGSDKNLPSNYRNFSRRLKLPIDKIKNEESSYVEDLNLKAELQDSIEDTVYFDDIFPHRLGTVTGTDSKDILSFYDADMDFDLNELDAKGNTRWLIKGVSAKIIFNTGGLAGQEFELQKYSHTKKKFTLIEFSDERGLKMPSASTEAFRVRKGDKYVITQINLPDTYIKSAEEELYNAAIKHLAERKQPCVSYSQKFDPMYFKEHFPAQEQIRPNLFLPGYYVPIKDANLGVKKNLKIQKVTRNLLEPYAYSLDLSDITELNSGTSLVQEIIEHKQIIKNNNLKDPNKAKRSWRSTEELRNMVYDPDGYFDTINIKPESIETNMLSVGAKSQNFLLQEVLFEPNYQGKAHIFQASSGMLIHLSIDKDKPRTWMMSTINYELTDKGAYYLFAKCGKKSDKGLFMLSQETYTTEPESDQQNYYFQIGILSSEKEGFRQFTSTYGYTTINGNTITSGKITTLDGESYLDLDGNKFKIGNAESFIDWSVSKDKQLTLSNVKLLSSSGAVSGIGVFRGEYDKNTIYYKDDEVTFKGSTYRYINVLAGNGKEPSDKAYWIVMAQKGASPALVFRGDYADDKLYYGTETRVDAVRYKDIYYIANIDAGEGFSGRIPTNSNYWSTFGAQFESISTNLLLAENARIGDWYHSGGKIISTLEENVSKITLDAKQAGIFLQNEKQDEYMAITSKYSSGISIHNKNGNYTEIGSGEEIHPTLYARSYDKTIVLGDGGGGLVIEGSTGITRITDGTIFTYAWATSGRDVWPSKILNLQINGLSGSVKYISDDSSVSDRELRYEDLLAIGLVNNGKTRSVWLPNDSDDGKIIIIRQMGYGSLNICPEHGYWLMHKGRSPSTSSISLYKGNMAICILGSCLINNVYYRIWTINLI